MSVRSSIRAWSALLLISTFVGNASPAHAQTAQPAVDAAVAEVRQMVTDARKEIESYRTGGGAAGAADHPAVKWDAALWQQRERTPRTDAAAIAGVEAIRFLVRAELWDRAHARIASIDENDPAWERLAPVIYEEGIARKDLGYSIDTLSRISAATTTPSIKAAAQLVAGRAYRRQGDSTAAVRSFETAKSTAPGTPAAIEAEGLIYEIEHLSIGMAAPPISGKPRNGRAINLSSFRGKPVVLVFWGTT